MEVAQALNLREWRASLQKFLLRLHDLRRFDLSEFTDEICPDILKRFTFAKPVQIGFDLFRPALGRMARCRFFLFRLCCSCQIRHFTDKFKTLPHQACYNIRHRDVFHLRTPGDRHHLADRIQHGLFRDLGKTKLCHNINEFRIFLRQFIDCFIQIKFLCHSNKLLCFLFNFTFKAKQFMLL